MSYLENCSHSPAVMFCCAEYFNLSEWNACSWKPSFPQLLNSDCKSIYAPAVPYSRSRCQVTSVLIEQGMLVLPLSYAPSVDVRIYYANWTTARMREQFFKLKI